MWLALGLSVHLLINIPGLGNVPLPHFGLKRTQPTAADSLPPTWRHASRLALENQFVDGRLAALNTGETNLGYTRLQVQSDPRHLEVSVDTDSGTVATTTELGDVSLAFEGRRTLSAYSADFMRQGFERRWADEARKNINSLGDATPQQAQHQGMSFQIPSPLPRGVQKMLGPGGPALNVYGSENIRISGTSNWSNLLLGQGNQKRSLFPTLDMQQDLDIRLEGQLSDRIRVNLLQNSANQIPLANRIAINYKGDEDALFQQVDLGNTNLTLPGTQYVSYSGKNEGLFGAKASSRIGPLDFTLLASKQEGRSERASYSGGSVKQTQSLRDLEYIKGVYFLLYDPNVEGPYDISEASLNVYRDDVTATNDVNVVRGIALVHPEQLSSVIASDSLAQLGNPKPPVAARGNFDLLTKGVDYDILTTVYNTTYRVLRLRSSLNGEQRLAVTYQRRRVGSDGLAFGPIEQVGGFQIQDVDGDTSRVMKLIRVGPNVIGASGVGLDAVYDTSAALYPTRELELRNFYQLPGRNIDKQSLKITIRRGRDDPPITSVLNPGTGLAIPYIEVLGLDNLDETQGTPTQGHDGRIDGLAVESRQTFVDYDNGLLYFLEPRPFAPRLGANRKPFDGFISTVLFRRDSLTGPPGSSTEPNPAIYDKYNLQTDTDARYFIDVEYSGQSAGGDITLGRGNILEGSDVVTVNGQALQRGRDYDIDYDLGRVTLKRTLGPTDNLNIDYSYAPLFQQAGRTLLGSAFRLEGRNKSLGGAFLYESHGAQDIRPRLGEEPSRSLIGDLNTDWSFQPGWMTRLVDHLPGVRTTAPSELKFQAEVGASLPNPNTKNEVYIDDMEGVRDAVSLTMDASRWRWSSVPSRPTSVLDGVAIQPKSLLDLVLEGSKTKNAEVHWFSPYAVVKEHDLKPSLSDAQGGQNNRQVLAISIPRRPLTVDNGPTTFDSLWVGLTYPLDPHGIDLSKSQFLELWVNDFNDYHEPSTQRPRIRLRHVRMHIDVGTVSEDQMRSPDVPPDNALNTEDRNQDGTLDVTSNNEDTGVDGQLDTDEPGPPLDLVTASDQDPHGDDYQPPNRDYEEEIDARRYLRTNGLEGNKNLTPYPDTEDLDGGGAINRTENYVEYSFDLGDSKHPYLATEVDSAYAGFPNVGPDNGWRRYRIPIDDSLRVAFGNPNLAAATQVRVWFDGLTLPDVPADSCAIGARHVERPLLMLGSLDIVGSRWRAGVVDSSDVKVGGSMTLNAVNTLDNAEIYAPPFDPGSTRNGSQELTRREQSIDLEFTRFGTGHSIEAFRTLSLDEDYSRYGKLNWFVAGYGLVDSLGVSTNDGLEYFVRFSSDELGSNYYEYRAPLPNSPGPRNIAWSDVRIGLSEMSSIKLLKGAAASLDTIVARTPGSLDSLAVKGRPSFTRLRRISFGIVNRRGAGFYERGQMWFDELRGIDVQKDQGFAQRVLVSGRFANLFQYNFNWNGRDANFAGVGEQRGSGNTNNSYSFSSEFDLHRFFEATGIVLPVTFNFAQNTVQPRFSAGSDVVFGAADQARSETFSDSRGWAVSYSRAWSDRANPLLRYTVGGITANYSTQSTHGHSPVSADRTTASSLGINYGIAPRNVLVLKLPLVTPHLYPLPERFYINYRTDERRSAVLERIPYSDDFAPKSLVAGRAGGINLGADTRPFDFLHHHYEQARNLNLPYYPFTDATRRSVNVGSLVSWMQNMDASYTARLHPWLSPQLSWNARYNQGNGPELSPDLSVRSIANGQQGTVRMTFPFGDLLRQPAAAQRPAMPDTSRRPRSQRTALWRNALSRFGNIGADFSVGKSSAYSRLTGSPDFLYLFGLSNNPGLIGAPGDPARMHSQFGNTSNQNFDWHASARTSLVTGFGSTIQALGDYATRTSTTNGAQSSDDKLRFPDLQFDYGQVPNVLRIDKVLHNPRLRTSFNRTQTVSYANGRDADKTGSSRGFQFQPLLGLSGDLTNGTRVELSIEHRNTETEILQLGRSLTFDRNTDINFSINRQYSQGQKFTFMGKESTVRSSISMGLTTVFSRQTGGIETIINGIPSTRSPTEKERLSVNTNGSYGFSSNLSARAELGFVQDHNKTSDIVNRTVRVELSARFSF